LIKVPDHFEEEMAGPHRDLESEGPQVFVFLCRRVLGGEINTRNHAWQSMEMFRVIDACSSSKVLMSSATPTRTMVATMPLSESASTS